MNASRNASAAAKDQVARLLTLVPYLHARREVRIEDAAKVLDVTPDQVLSDLKVLFMCGLPGGYPDDLIDVDIEGLENPESDGVIRVSNADYLSRPMRLTPTEASAVMVALRALRGGAREETREIVDRAMAKLEAAASESTAAARVDPGEGAADTDLALLTRRLQGAVDARRQVLLGYYVPSRDEQSDRVVDPRGLVTAEGHTYLDAWCHTAEAPRLFRLDRIESAEVLDEQVSTPTEAPRNLADGFFAQSTNVTRTTLRLEPPARWAIGYYPAEEVRSLPDGALEVDFLVADERWLTRLLLRLAPHAHVVSPAAYAETFRNAAQQALSLYAAPGVR
jgi:proteasome accessory factor C